MNLVLNVILACITNTHELSRRECVEIYKAGAREVEAEFPEITLKRVRVLYLHRHSNLSPDPVGIKDTMKIVQSEVFKVHDYNAYDLHLAIMSRPKPWYIAGGYTMNNCGKDSSIIILNGGYFAERIPFFTNIMSHEIFHMLGAKHDAGGNWINFKQTVERCLSVWNHIVHL